MIQNAMEHNTYLDKVRIFLEQELPAVYRDSLALQDGKIVVKLAGAEDFQECYESLHSLIGAQISRIRNRQFELGFVIRSDYQEREFMVLK